MKSTNFWNSDRVISLLAIFLSLGTLIVFLYQTTLIRKHQYASVMPYLEIGGEGLGTTNYKYYIENNGVGPALITDVKIHYKKQVYETEIIDFLKNKFPSLNDSLGMYYYSSIRSGSLIPAGQKIDLIEVIDSKDTGYLLNDIFNSDKAKIEVTYESIYGESWKIKEGHLSPFKIN